MTLEYLSLDKYETRLDQALWANTAGDLAELVADLPADRTAPAGPRRRAPRSAAAQRGIRIHTAAYLAAVLTAVGVWLPTGIAFDAWYFWPVWPILGGAIGVVSHTLPVQTDRQRNR